ncbi:MAG: hydroxyacid dehydrogenase [Acidimicrobiaceae bacterium]|nr:hydroxyacid dehydrogenase [Acidimicrobiaceae bacterium]
MSRAEPKIVIAHMPQIRGFTDADLDRVANVGTVLDRVPISAWNDSRADALLAVADVVLAHWGCPAIDATVLDRAPNLGLIAYAAGTVKTVVTDAVWTRDIRVTSGAVANAEPVAEFTIAAILWANKDALWRRVHASQPDQPTTAGVPRGNYGKTIGLVGASLVGRRVIELLALFPDLDVTLYDPFVTLEEAADLGVTKLELDELCAGCDVLSVHAPLLTSTVGLVGAPHLAALRDGATVINTARGPIIDHDALTVELTSGRLRAVLDVTDPEPLADDSPLRSLSNVWLTPHLAGSEGTELARMADHAIDEITRWSQGRPARNEITKGRLDRLA